VNSCSSLIYAAYIGNKKTMKSITNKDGHSIKPFARVKQTIVLMCVASSRYLPAGLSPPPAPALTFYVGGFG
jgi:hypothetical protein